MYICLYDKSVASPAMYVSKPNNTSTVEFRVSTLKDIINVIIPHFDSYPLITQKFSDYILFKQVVLLMLDKEHNNLEGWRMFATKNC
jgi:hypothetical protein